METDAPQANAQIARKGDQEHAVMAVLEAAGDALVGEEHKGQVCQGVDDLSRVDRGIVVLCMLLLASHWNRRSVPLRTS